MISGHSHQPKIETVGGVVYLNPGSAGPRRFKLPITLATVDLTADPIKPFIHTLGTVILGCATVMTKLHFSILPEG